LILCDTRHSSLCYHAGRGEARGGDKTVGIFKIRIAGLDTIQAVINVINFTDNNFAPSTSRIAQHWHCAPSTGIFVMVTITSGVILII